MQSREQSLDGPLFLSASSQRAKYQLDRIFYGILARCLALCIENRGNGNNLADVYHGSLPEHLPLLSKSAAY